ncbi:MAG: argininosuccinate lyase [Verrucomicrobia bacterium]|nr:argininosuccinate lyase [Verrucomicrobiota bacterium]
MSEDDRTQSEGIQPPQGGDPARPPARSGRFAAGPAAETQAFSESISFDWRLWEQDIRGSKAHARMLRKIGVLDAGELEGILRGLDEIAADIRAGKFPWRPELEDVHMNIEAELTRRVPAGAKLHTGRSRNDQIALDMRLWLRDRIDELTLALRRLQLALAELGGRHRRAVIPGYTHLQRAQPVLFAHHLLAYVEMFERDAGRLADARERANECPLGCGALAGSTLPLDREAVARELGFVDRAGKPRLTRNSMDAVGDRDFVVEFCAAAALLAVHLSRLSEDLILWASAEFGFIRISDAYSTGSSLMPQKRNPDVAELIRGKSGRVIGNLTAMLTLLKGLPMTYNRDLQEDKERLFDSADTVLACVRLMAGMLEQAELNEKACRRAASDPTLLATDLADWLVSRGVPFREAHDVVGRLVACAESLGKPLHRLSAEELAQVDPRLTVEARAVFSLRRALERRRAPGAPSFRNVSLELRRWRSRLRKLLEE